MTFILTSTLRVLRCSGSKYTTCNSYRQISTTVTLRGLFFESDPKSGYRKKSPIEGIPRVQLIREGFQELRKEVALWKEEVKEKFAADPLIIFRPGETDVLWNFKTDECLNKWTTTSDSDNNEGYSSCSLIVNNRGKGIFSGTLNTRVPKDGQISRSGYCNLRSLRARKSFKRDSHYDWNSYNALILRVRGDGRTYLLNLSVAGYFDVTWNDIYCYALYTRGGPYWQYVKIPFSKFFLTSKGRVQDRQVAVPLDRISHFGITVGDKINGPFSLEIDYIGVEFDPNIDEEFAYEMYQTGKYIVAH